MTLAETSPVVARPGPEDAVGFLLRDRAWNAYGLGYMEPGAATKLDLVSAQREGEILGLLVIAQVANLSILFATGAPDGIAEILERTDRLPASGVFSTRPGGLRQLQPRLQPGAAYRMSRMRLLRGELRPRRVAVARRLGVSDLAEVRAIYGMWTDSQQLPAQL